MKAKKILFINIDEELLKIYSDAGYETEVISSTSLMSAVAPFFLPDLIFVNSVQNANIAELRKNEKLLKVPVVVIAESFRELNNLNAVSEYPYVLICNRACAADEAFMEHIKLIAEKEVSPLPVRTGRSVKYSILFMNRNVSKVLVRKTIADQIGISEDYLTKIFKKEMGMSLWDYLTEYRLFVARKMLLESGLSVGEIAAACGFSDDAYFNNVFRDYYKCSPGSLRKR